MHFWQEYHRNHAMWLLNASYHKLHDADMWLISLITWLGWFLLGSFIVKLLSFPLYIDILFPDLFEPIFLKLCPSGPNPPACAVGDSQYHSGPGIT